MKSYGLRLSFFCLTLIMITASQVNGQQNPVMILQAGGGFSRIEVENGYVYFTKGECGGEDPFMDQCFTGEPSEPGVFKISVNGANWEDPTTWDALALGYWAGHLDVYGEYVFFVEGGSIFKVPKDGGDVIKVIDTFGGIYELKADNNHIYWTEEWEGAVKRVQKDGGQWELVAGGLGWTRHIDLDPDNVYWGQGGKLQFRPKAGGPITTIVEGMCCAGPNFVLNADYVYYGNIENNLARYSKATQESVQLATGFTTGLGLAIDNEYVYIHDEAHCCPPIGGILQRIHIDGGPMTILIPDQANRIDFKTDGISICWIQVHRELYKLGISTDTEGPHISNVVADLNPVSVNTPIVLKATVDDTTTGESNIAAAEYSIDGGSFVSMDSQDGAFDEVSEEVVTNVPGFPQAGVYTICVHGQDAANNIGLSGCILVAVYDPDGGFVTGGGWISSPLGAYSDDPTLEGKANFGFVSKYKKDSNVPTGQMEFQFRVADLNFHSNSYDWLVVTGSNYAKFKGSGLINDQVDPDYGEYNFMVWAGDKNPDTFRIKIWAEDVDGAEFVVYDNEIEQSIEGGSIVVHSE